MWRSIRSDLPRLLAAVTLASLIYFGRLWSLLLVNLYGPVRATPGAALALALGAAVICAALYFGVGRLLLRFSPALLAGFLVASFAVGFALAPTVCDTHESWREVPNQRCSCQGWMFEYYKPGILDGASSDYCVGWEQPVAVAP